MPSVVAAASFSQHMVDLFVRLRLPMSPMVVADASPGF